MLAAITKTLKENGKQDSPSNVNQLAAAIISLGVMEGRQDLLSPEQRQATLDVLADKILADLGPYDSQKLNGLAKNAVQSFGDVGEGLQPPSNVVEGVVTSAPEKAQKPGPTPPAHRDAVKPPTTLTPPTTLRI